MSRRKYYKQEAQAHQKTSCIKRVAHVCIRSAYGEFFALAYIPRRSDAYALSEQYGDESRYQKERLRGRKDKEKRQVAETEKKTQFDPHFPPIMYKNLHIMAMIS